MTLQQLKQLLERFSTLQTEILAKVIPFYASGVRHVLAGWPRFSEDMKDLISEYSTKLITTNFEPLNSVKNHPRRFLFKAGLYNATDFLRKKTKEQMLQSKLFESDTENSQETPEGTEAPLHHTWEWCLRFVESLRSLPSEKAAA